MELTDGLGLGILVLDGTLPLAEVPLLTEEKLVVLVRHGRRREVPGSLESRTVSVASSESVSSRESD
jgi:hypothetical protein